MKKIDIKCSGNKTLPIESLRDFQGNLAELSTVSYNKLKKSLIKYGISFAFSVWEDGGKFYLLDGHARVKTLKLLIEEGYDIPELPCVIVQADNIKQAKAKLLVARSEYHKTTEEGLYEFLSEAQIDADDALECVDFSSIDISKFTEGYLNPENEEQQGTEKESMKISFNKNDKHLIVEQLKRISEKYFLAF